MKTYTNRQALLPTGRGKLTSRRASQPNRQTMKSKVNLMIAKMTIEQLVAFALNIVSKMTANSNFATPSPALSAITTATNALQTAYDNAQGGGPAQTSLMHQKRTALELLLTALGHYVEDRANDPVNASTGPEAIILSSGMNIKHISLRQKQVFSVQHGESQGSVVLKAAKIIRGTHEWQYTNDINNPSAWVAVTPTIKANVTISGLERFKAYYFRHRIVSASGYSEWENSGVFTVL
jgi:hypothetical protein